MRNRSPQEHEGPTDYRGTVQYRSVQYKKVVCILMSPGAKSPPPAAVASLLKMLASNLWQAFSEARGTGTVQVQLTIVLY